MRRLWTSTDSVTGVLEVDSRSTCYTLEDAVLEQPGLDVKEWKIPGKTAIPRGRYKVVMDFSNRFGRIMPHILDVPGFTGVRFHGGNTSEQTEGCVLLGEKRIDDHTIAECEPACRELSDLILAALANHEEIYVTVT